MRFLSFGAMMLLLLILMLLIVFYGPRLFFRTTAHQRQSAAAPPLSVLQKRRSKHARRKSTTTGSGLLQLKNVRAPLPVLRPSLTQSPIGRRCRRLHGRLRRLPIVAPTPRIPQRRRATSRHGAEAPEHPRRAPRRPPARRSDKIRNDRHAVSSPSLLSRRRYRESAVAVASALDADAERMGDASAVRRRVLDPIFVGDVAATTSALDGDDEFEREDDEVDVATRRRGKFWF